MGSFDSARLSLRECLAPLRMTESYEIMARRKKSANDNQPSLLDITAKLRSGPCVPALREAIKSWKAGGCKGITDTTSVLLNYWFCSDHKLKTGRPFKYHDSQR